MGVECKDHEGNICKTIRGYAEMDVPTTRRTATRTMTTITQTAMVQIKQNVVLKIFILLFAM